MVTCLRAGRCYILKELCLKIWFGKMLAEFKAAVNKTDDDKKDEEDKTKD